MANQSFVQSICSYLPTATDVTAARGPAYKYDRQHALALLAFTAVFGNSFYANTQTQLDEIRRLIDQVDDNEFLAKLAVYCREHAFMKDMPAAMLLALSCRDTDLVHQVFDRVVGNGSVLCPVFQMTRRGQLRRKSLRYRCSERSSVG